MCRGRQTPHLVQGRQTDIPLCAGETDRKLTLCMGRQTCRQKPHLMLGETDGQTDRQTNGSSCADGDIQTERHVNLRRERHTYTHTYISPSAGGDRQMDRQTDTLPCAKGRHKHIQTDISPDGGGRGRGNCSKGRTAGHKQMEREDRQTYHTTQRETGRDYLV